MTGWLTNWLAEALRLTRNSNTRRALGHSDPQGYWALGHLVSEALGHLRTQALRHLDTRGTQGTSFSRLFKNLHTWLKWGKWAWKREVNIWRKISKAILRDTFSYHRCYDENQMQRKNLLIYRITSNVSVIRQLRLLIVFSQKRNPVFMNLQLVDLTCQSVRMMSKFNFVEMFLLKVLV